MSTWEFEPESEADPPGFEPESEAPETPIISRLYHGSSDHKVRRVWKGKGLAVDEPAILVAPFERVEPK